MSLYFKELHICFVNIKDYLHILIYILSFSILVTQIFIVKRFATLYLFEMRKFV